MSASLLAPESVITSVEGPRRIGRRARRPGAGRAVVAPRRADRAIAASPAGGKFAAQTDIWIDRAACTVLAELGSRPLEREVLLVDPDPVRLCLLELHRAVVLGQDPERWPIWWRGDPRPWLDEVLGGPWLSRAAADFWGCHRGRLRAGLNGVVLPSASDSVQRILLGTLFLPRVQAERLLGIPGRVRRSGRFLDFCGRRRWLSGISTRVAAMVLRVADPFGRAPDWRAAINMARRWQGMLTSRLLKCDPVEDEILRRWYGLPLASEGGGGSAPASDQLRANWQRVTLLPRTSGVPATSSLPLWQALD